MVESEKSDEKMMTTVQQEYKILAEYKMVESEKTGGIYVIPSYENSLLWFGVIFVRDGYFKDGIFRFNISLPDKFPEDKNPPTIIFQSEIFHPLICPYTGTLDISSAFPQWRNGEDHIWQLIKYISFIFLEPEESLRSSRKHQNQNAADLFSQNRDDFIVKVKDCVQLSIEHAYEASPVDDPHYITFEKFSGELHGPILDNMKTDGAKAVSTSTPPNSGLSWVKEGEFKPLSKE